jgi:hypothetical protein
MCDGMIDDMTDVDVVGFTTSGDSIVVQVMFECGGKPAYQGHWSSFSIETKSSSKTASMS